MPRALPELLAEWADWDAAAHLLAANLGLVPADSAWDESKWVYWSANPLGDGLRACLDALVAAGVLERRDEPDTQYRWCLAVPPPPEPLTAPPVPRPCSLVRFRFEMLPAEYHDR